MQEFFGVIGILSLHRWPRLANRFLQRRIRLTAAAVTVGRPTAQSAFP